MEFENENENLRFKVNQLQNQIAEDQKASSSHISGQNDDINAESKSRDLNERLTDDISVPCF